MKLLVKMYGGSRMHGTNTPNSDTDILGVFLPELDDLILETATKCIKTSTGSDNERNNKDDVDTTYYSLNYFLHLLEQGQTVALEMLSVKKEDLLLCTPEWEYLMEHRKDFYTNNMKAFIGYCKSQAHIYSRKGERIRLVKNILKTLNNHRDATNPFEPADNLWDILNLELDLNELQEKYGKENIFLENPGENKITLLNVCGRKFQVTISDKNFILGLNNILDKYGKRAEEASKGTMDCKAVSHAFRVLKECEEIATTGDLQLPLKDREFIIKVKLGQVDAGYCFDLLDKELAKVEKLVEQSSLPEKVNMKPYKEWVLDIYDNLLVDIH